jgi:hypothetical protein
VLANFCCGSYFSGGIGGILSRAETGEKVSAAAAMVNVGAAQQQECNSICSGHTADRLRVSTDIPAAPHLRA